MNVNLSYILSAHQTKKEALLSFMMKDSFFDGVAHDLIDYGYDLKFSITGGAGAYKPFALSTEKLDTPAKQHQFANGFWKMSEAGKMKAKIQLSLLLGAEGNAHTFLHEIMHFYQDMHGLYFVPLKEEGVLPIMLDARSDVTVILFNEAWAEVEAIRTCWALNQKGDSLGWNGAVQSPDWKHLANGYDTDLNSGVDEAKAAANCFKRWYQGQNRIFYEQHAMKIFDLNYKRFLSDIVDMSDATVTNSLRSLDLPLLMSRIPVDDVPKYFAQIDLADELYSAPKSADVAKRLDVFEARYGVNHSTDIQDIRNGSPPYIWKRLRNAEVSASDVPPH